MIISNERATEIMNEIKQGIYDNIAELKIACDKQVKLDFNPKRCKFLPEWGIDDLCGEVFERVWKDCMKFDEQRAVFSTWLNLLARTIYIKQWKKRKRQFETITLYVLDNDEEEYCVVDDYHHTRSSEEEYFDKERCSQLLKSITQLPPNQKAAIEICKLDGHKPAEAARIMGCKASDIYRWLNRGLDRLERDMEREELSADNEYDRAA